MSEIKIEPGIDEVLSLIDLDKNSIKFPKTRGKNHTAIDKRLFELTNRDYSFIGMFITLATYVSPGTTTICYDGNVARKLDIYKILDRSERVCERFLREARAYGLIKKQKFIFDTGFYYEYMVNPVYFNYLHGEILYSDFYIWKDEIIKNLGRYPNNTIDIWNSLLSVRFLKDFNKCVVRAKTPSNISKIPENKKIHVVACKRINDSFELNYDFIDTVQNFN